MTATTTTAITGALLSEQSAATTNAIIDRYGTDQDFLSLSKSEGEATLKRDNEDGEKLQRGIDLAMERGVLDKDFVPEEYVSVDVLGKTPSEVADEILARVEGDARGSGAGGLIILCGLSGTGKGTTVSALKSKLETQGGGRAVVCWSNGNVFRSLTLLAVTWCEKQCDCQDFDPERALTKENLAAFAGMLEFGKFNGKFDTRIKGLGLDLLVSKVQNTKLKEPKVSRNIPTVAEMTQGEVIMFASSAVKQMGEDGIFVLLEGREQTVNYFRTPLRFTLTLSDSSLIGKRRAAQRLAAAALGEAGKGTGPDEVGKALDRQLRRMVDEAGAH